MRLRWWRAVEDVPEWAVSRVAQAFCILGIGVLVGGIVAAYEVRFDPPGMRPYVVAFLMLDICLLLAVGLRIEHVRRSRSGTRTPSTGDGASRPPHL